MVVVLLPSLLAAQADGRKRFEVEGPTLEAVLQALPIADLLFDEHGALRPLVNVYVDGRDVRELDGLATVVSTETVRVVAAVAGG